jgi:hypothetical protein
MAMSLSTHTRHSDDNEFALFLDRGDSEHGLGIVSKIVGTAADTRLGPVGMAETILNVFDSYLV